MRTDKKTFSFATFVVVLSLLLIANPALASKRVALVIGNADYDSISPLQNPKSDAKAVSSKLKDMGFRLIGKSAWSDGKPVYDLDQESFYETLDRFADKARNAEIAMVYYAGHGMQIDGEAYLLPTDVKAPTKKVHLNLLTKSSIGLEEILAMIDQKADLTVAVFDACREIPDIDKLTRSSGLSSRGYRGLSRVKSQGKNRIIAYSGGSGELVEDGAGRNSPYTATLLDNLNKPGLDVPQVFQTVAYKFSQEHDGQSPELLIQGVPPNKYFLLAGGSIQPSPAPLPSPSGNKGDLTIHTTPVGATLFLDGGYLGKSPQTINGLKANKRYSIEARLSGYESTTERVKVTSGKHHKISLSLDSGGSHLTVNTTPSNAKVRILNIKPAYYDGIKLDEGSYHIEVSATGYQKVKKWIQVSGANHYETVELQKGTSTHPLIKQLGMNFVDIPSGSFMMGSNDGDNDEKPVHRVRVPGFKMMTTEVTQAQWQAVMGSNPSNFKSCGSNCPVERVSWDDIQKFIKKLNAKTGKVYRLPSEAEWEYAARAGSTTKYAWGNSIDCSKARYGYYSDECGKQKRTDPVGSFAPNEYGLYDMHGNVWEWTQDCWNDSYSGAPSNGRAWESGNCKKRVLRGGSWYELPNLLRSAYRFGYNSDFRYGTIGFRLVQGR